MGWSGTTPKAAAHVNKYNCRPHQKGRTTQGLEHVKPTFFFFVSPWSSPNPRQSQLDRKNKTKSVSQNHLKHYFRAGHQPLRGLLVEIEDVLHNIISSKTLNTPKEMNAVSTEEVLPFSPPVRTFAHPYFLKSTWQYYGAPYGRLFGHVVLSHFTLLSSSHLPISKITSS